MTKYEPNNLPEKNEFKETNFQGSLRQELERVTLQKTDAATLTVEELWQASAVYKNCFEAPPWNEEWPMEDAIATLREYANWGSDIILAKGNGVVIGVIVGLPLEKYPDGAGLFEFSSSRNPFYLADFAVAPEYQNKGLGKELVDELLCTAKNEGFKSVITRTKLDNIRAIRVFLDFDFGETGRYDAETGGVTSERVVFEREL